MGSSKYRMKVKQTAVKKGKLRWTEEDAMDLI